MHDPDQPEPIKPLRVERHCDPQPDLRRLVLNPNVNTTEIVRRRTLVEIAGAELPGAIVSGDDGDSDSAWDLYLALRYRQDWTPIGYGLGDLVYSLSMLPGEELTLEVKTWETSKTQQDREDSTESKNVSDLKHASSVTHEVTTGNEATEQESLAGGAGWSGFGFSASVEGAWSEEVKTMRQSLAKESQERTQQQTNEYRSTHKVRMSLSREEGAENKTTRKLRNINQTRTLNANYYEVLQEYRVELRLEATTMVLLGIEPNLMSPIELRDGSTATARTIFLRRIDDDGAGAPDIPPGYELPPSADDGDLEIAPVDPPIAPDSGREDLLTLGQLLRVAREPRLVSLFMDEHGVSPVKLLRELWSRALRESAIVPQDLGAPGATITPEDRAVFQSAMLAHVRPVPGWLAPDKEGRLRWAYEVFPGRESSLLTLLYQLVPYGAQQQRARARRAGMDTRAVDAALARRMDEVSVERRTSGVALRRTAPAPAARATDLQLAEAGTILAEGPLHGTSIEELPEAIATWVGKLVDRFAEVREDEQPLSSWTATVPTQSVHAEVSLGVCSGAEDYYELQRHFELEQRRLEVERLRLENERLRLENEARRAGEPDVRIRGRVDRATVRVDVEQGDSQRTVEIEENDES